MNPCNGEILEGGRIIKLVPFGDRSVLGMENHKLVGLLLKREVVVF